MLKPKCHNFYRFSNVVAIKAAKAQPSSLPKSGITIANLLPDMYWLNPADGWGAVGINLGDLTPGKELDLFNLGEVTLQHASVGLADDESEYKLEKLDAIFLDENFEPTDIVSGDASKMHILISMGADANYETPFVAVDATESDLAALKEFEAAVSDIENSDGTDSEKSIGGSSGGCNLMRSEELGMRNVLILVLFALLFVSMKKSEVKKT